MSFTMFCVTNAPATTVQPNSFNPVGFHGTPGLSITVQVTGSAMIKGVNPVKLDETGYGRVDIVNAVAESVTVFALAENVQQSEQMNFVAGYSITADGSGNLYQLTENAPADGKTPNVIFSPDLNGFHLSVTKNALFADGTNHYDSKGATNIAAELFDQYPESTGLFESSGLWVKDIAFIPVL